MRIVIRGVKIKIIYDALDSLSLDGIGKIIRCRVEFHSVPLDEN